MHELSIAMSLIDAVCEQLPALGADVRVDAVRVRVGAWSGVAPEALLFSFEVAAAGTAIEGARLDLERTGLVVWCDDCRAEQTLEPGHWLRCPACGGETPAVVSGRELELVALEVTDGSPNR
jgi:hydrogenase nickel incorporation protein HypA/HybF